MIVGFVIGLLVGACVGLLIASLLVTAARADEDMAARLRRTLHTCGPQCAPLANVHRNEWGQSS